MATERIWMKVDSGIAHSRKLALTAQALGVSRCQVIGHLVSLWGWAANFVEDGRIGDFDPRDIAQAAGWAKRPEVFTDSLAAFGWVDDGVLHEWSKWGGAGVLSRAASRERARTVREQYAQNTRLDKDRDRDKEKTETKTTSKTSAARTAKPRPNDRTEYLLGKLAESDERWAAVSWPAIQKLVNEYGTARVNSALGMCTEGLSEIIEPYPYLESVCRDLGASA